jgi:hypothetical protein
MPGFLAVPPPASERESSDRNRSPHLSICRPKIVSSVVLPSEPEFFSSLLEDSGPQLQAWPSIGSSDDMSILERPLCSFRRPLNHETLDQAPGGVIGSTGAEDQRWTTLVIWARAGVSNESRHSSLPSTALRSEWSRPKGPKGTAQVS